MNIFSFLHFFVFLFYSCLLMFLLWKDPKSSLNRACAAFFACLALWSFAYIFIHNFNISKDTAKLFDNISSIGWASFGGFFLWFSLIFTEKKKILKTKMIYPLIFTLPLLFIYTQWAGLLTVDYIKRPWGWEAAWSGSIWWTSYFIYYLSFTVIGLYLILNFRRKTKEPIKKKQAGIIFIATLVTLLLGFFTEVILSGLHIYSIPLLGDVNTLCWAFGIVFAMVKYKLMIITPSAAAENIVSTMADSLILLDRQGNITTVNKAALDLSGYGKDELTGKPVELFFREKGFKGILLDRAIKGESIRNDELNFKTKTGNNIPVIFSSSAMMDKAGEMAGIVCVVKDITERKKTEMAIVYEQSLLHDLMENIPDFIYFKDEKNRFVRVNKTSAEDRGVTPEDFIGKTDFDIFNEEAAKKCIADDDQVMKTGKSLINKIEKITYLNGMERWFSVTKVPRYDKKGKIIGTIGITRDITEHKQAEENVKNAKDELEIILDSVPAIIFYKDIESKIILANKTLADSLKIPIKDIIGKTPEELFPKDQAESMKKGDQEVMISGKLKRNIIQPYTTPDGIRWLNVDKIPYKDKKGKIIGIIGLAKDITEQRKSEEELRQSYQQLKKTMDATIDTMSSIIEAKDPYTAGHQQRVSQLATAIAKELHLSQNKIEGIRIASLIHDIGKIGIPTEILSKPIKLSDIEFNLIKEHSQIGYNILKSIDFSYPVANIVLQHHEKLNGSGYPNHLKGDKILPEARILGVADVVEAMSSHRPYRPALGIDKALEEITQNKGILYDPKAVDTCLKLFKEKGFKFE